MNHGTFVKQKLMDKIFSSNDSHRLIFYNLDMNHDSIVEMNYNHGIITNAY